MKYTLCLRAEPRAESRDSFSVPLCLCGYTTQLRTLTQPAQNSENPSRDVNQQPQQGGQKAAKESGNEQRLSEPIVMYRVHQLSSFSNVLNVSSSRLSLRALQ